MMSASEPGSAGVTSVVGRPRIFAWFVPERDLEGSPRRDNGCDANADFKDRGTVAGEDVGGHETVSVVKLVQYPESILALTLGSSTRLSHLQGGGVNR